MTSYIPLSTPESRMATQRVLDRLDSLEYQIAFQQGQFLALERQVRDLQESLNRLEQREAK